MINEDNFTAKGLHLVVRNPEYVRAQGVSHPSNHYVPVKIRSDSRLLYRTLENLFSNAAKYALEGTRVFAEITWQDERTLFTLQKYRA